VNTLTIPVDNTWMAIQVPDCLNEYEKLVNVLGLRTGTKVAEKIALVNFDLDRDSKPIEYPNTVIVPGFDLDEPSEPATP